MTEQELATVILNRCHALGEQGVPRNQWFEDKYIREWEATLRIVREAAPIRQCIERTR
jgi:hypothetical protein